MVYFSSKKDDNSKHLLDVKAVVSGIPSRLSGIGGKEAIESSKRLDLGRAE